MDSAAAFGKLVRARREALGLSQEQFAADSYLHRTEVSLIERGRKDVRLETACYLARSLGVAPAELLDGLRIDELEPRPRPRKRRRARPDE